MTMHPPAPPPPPDTTAKVALVGIGYWGSKLLRNLVSLLGSEGVVAVDSHLDRLAWVCSQYPAVACESNLAAALADPDVNAVIIATPVQSHGVHARTALEAGRHVLVEKPLTTCANEAAELAGLADQRRLRLMVGHTFLFSPRVSWIKDRLTTGGIGQVHYLTSSRLNLGQHRSDANVIWDLAPHDFSIILHLLGEMPVTAQTSARSVVRSGLPEVAFIDLTFPSGVIASIAVSWLAPRKVRNMVIVGDESMVVYDDTEPDEPVKVYDKGIQLEESADFGTHQLTYRYGDTVAPHIPVQEPLAEQLAHFVRSTNSGETPISDGWFGAGVVAALQAADRSWLEGGHPVPVEPVLPGEPVVQQQNEPRSVAWR